MLNIKELEHKIMSTADDNIPKKMATKKSKKANLLALTPEQKEYVKQQKFKGDGMLFRAKLIGIESVPQARGDKMCQEAMQRLKVIVSSENSDNILTKACDTHILEQKLIRFNQCAKTLMTDVIEN
uniref:Disabled homolog 2-like n=1 Tax=Saccoglossus kowalevskii TaxID=10224 RepID=A0ABM0MY16_SACKO|nr:PREDICTED: disabled homolog 2-like [Saccoglossus kowalevskii]